MFPKPSLYSRVVYFPNILDLFAFLHVLASQERLPAVPVAAISVFEETGVAVPEKVGRPGDPAAAEDGAAAATVGLRSGGAICNDEGIETGIEFVAVGASVFVDMLVDLTVTVLE